MNPEGIMASLKIVQVTMSHSQWSACWDITWWSISWCWNHDFWMDDFPGGSLIGFLMFFKPPFEFRRCTGVPPCYKRKLAGGCHDTLSLYTTQCIKIQYLSNFRTATPGSSFESSEPQTRKLRIHWKVALSISRSGPGRIMKAQGTNERCEERSE